MFENPLHRLAVVGAVGRHGSPRSRLFGTASPIGPTGLWLAILAALSARGLGLPAAIHLPVAPRLPRLARRAGLLSAAPLLAIGLLPVPLAVAATSPLGSSALPGRARLARFSALPLRTAPRRIAAGLRLFATFVAATGGAILLPRLGFTLPLTRLRLLPLRTLL
ncbi:MAG: hypothetical protein ACKOHG_08520 [Planctomycetia bacterium]